MVLRRILRVAFALLPLLVAVACVPENDAAKGRNKAALPCRLPPLLTSPRRSRAPPPTIAPTAAG